MSFVPNDKFKMVIRGVQRDLWAKEAFNPSEIKATAESLGATFTPATREIIAAEFGEEAAAAWQDIRDAKARYYKATESI